MHGLLRPPTAECHSALSEEFVTLAESLEAARRPGDALNAYRTFLSFWGQAEDDTDYQLPRTFRVSVGIRF